MCCCTNDPGCSYASGTASHQTRPGSKVPVQETASPAAPAHERGYRCIDNGAMPCPTRHIVHVFPASPLKKGGPDTRGAARYKQTGTVWEEYSWRDPYSTTNVYTNQTYRSSVCLFSKVSILLRHIYAIAGTSVLPEPDIAQGAACHAKRG